MKKRLTTIVALALALVMICGGIAIYAVGDANEKRIGDEDTAKVTPEASIDSEAKVKAEPEAVEGEESEEQLWKLQLEDTPAYIGMFLMDYMTRDFYVKWIPGIEDEELIAEFVEMLKGIRMRKVTDEEFYSYCDEEELNSGFNDASTEGFKLYSAEGRHIGTIFFSRNATFEYGKDFYPADNPGWCNWVMLQTEKKADASQSEIFIIDESTFDEELLERVWKECLCGVNPYDFIHNIDSVAAGDNPYDRNPINLYNIDVIEAYREKYQGEEFDDVIAVPVE